MAKNRIYLSLALGILFLTAGCDKVCKATVQDFVTVQNTTGRQLSLNVCKGETEEQMFVAANGISQEVSVGSHEESVISGGLGSDSCSASESKMPANVSLTPASFNQVKLCFNESTSLYVVTEKYQYCPTGFMEQTSTGPCNGSY